MARRIAVSGLNASTIDILNVIRKNAPQEYQNSVPRVEKETDIPKVGEIIYGTPAFANHFINALVGRIAMVAIQSATFNNPYSRLKRGYMEFGETIEEVFVGIAKVMHYTPEKAEQRELKRYLPDVKAIFHTINWRVMYPVTIEDEQLRTAFLSMAGVQSLIADIVEQVYTAAEYDEFLLFKYLLIKSIAHGGMKPISMGTGSRTGLNVAAEAFRATSNLLPFMLTDYNEMGVKNNTPKSRQIIFMDAEFNAAFDVNVLAGAFNMDKANFMGSLFLIDSWTTFDNDRFRVIREESDGLEEVTQEELDLMKNVHAVLIDERWFMVYDNLNKMTEKYAASGLYWNYFYHVWKVVSHSPFANAVVFVAENAIEELPENITVTVTAKDTTQEGAVLLTLGVTQPAGFIPQNYHFIQSRNMTTMGVAMQDYGVVMFPANRTNLAGITVEMSVDGSDYMATTLLAPTANVGATVTLQKQAARAVPIAEPENAAEPAEMKTAKKTTSK